MNIEYKANARFAGAMFLLAMAASLTGGMLIQGIISEPDFIKTIWQGKSVIIFGVALEFVNALAVIGIAASLWLPLSKRNPSMAAGYWGIRMIESVSCIAAALIPITMIALARQTDGGVSVNMLNIVRDSIVAYVIPLCFGIGGLLLYIMLYQSELVPRYITIWGMIAAPAVMFTMFVPVVMIKPLLALPIIINEIYLGLYLLAKGFRLNKKA